MSCTQHVTPDILWVGGGDRRLALFENIFPLDNGVTYNSYLILDEKVALVDTVDESITRQFFDNLGAALQGRGIDYLIVNHMEPDHCANIEEICRRWPEVKLVGNSKTFQYIRQFYGMDLEGRTIEVKEGSELSLGAHKLRFIMAPFVHWPEVMFTYDETADILFSADAFGTFGGYTGNLFCDQADYNALYLEESRRYYSNIVGKYGAQVTAVLKKLSGKLPATICPLHGPVLRGETLEMLVEKYSRWASYRPEKAGVVLAYASMYGNTEDAVNQLAGKLSARGMQDLRIFDVSKTHHSYIIAKIFEYSHVVLASPTYNTAVYHAMETVIRDMAALNVQGRGYSLIGNGTWAPTAHTQMQKMVEEMKNMTLIGEPLVIRSALTAQQDGELDALAEAIATSVGEVSLA